MPHLAPITNETASPQVKALLNDLQHKLGTVPNMYRTMAHAPQVLDAALVMGRAIRTDLNPKLRELVYVKIAELCKCEV